MTGSHSLDPSPAGWDRVLKWWRAPAGRAPAVLLLTGADVTGKQAVIERLIGLAEADECRWFRVRADGTVEGERDLLDELRSRIAQGQPPSSDTSPAPPAVHGAGRAPQAAPDPGLGAPAPRLLAVDDLAALGGLWPELAAEVEQAISDPTATRPGLLRIVVGTIAGRSETRTVPVSYVQARSALLRQTEQWVTDAWASPVLAVLGRPGSGKTSFLDAAAAVLAARGDVLLGGAFIDRPGRHRALWIGELYTRIGEALVESGVPIGGNRPSKHVIGAPTVVHTAPGVEVTGVKLYNSQFGRASATIGEVFELFEQRLASDAAGTPLLIVIDGIDEQDAEAREQLGAMLSAAGDLERWNVKVLVSAYESPDPAAQVLRVDDDPADIVSYARARLEHLAIPAPTLDDLSTRVAAVTSGLFIVAVGLLDELARDPHRHGWLDELTPVVAASDYFVGAIERIGEPDRRDAERILRILAVPRHGMTLGEIAAVWQAVAPGFERLPAVSSWDHILQTLHLGPAARFLLMPDDQVSGRYRLIHPTLREGLLRVGGPGAPADRPALKPADDLSGVQAERHRFLAGLTPLLGTGPGWDPITGRLAIAEVIPVLLDLVTQGRKREPVDAEQIAVAHRRIRQVLTDWDWLESAVRDIDDDEIGLGVAEIVLTLDRVATLDGFDPMLAFAAPLPIGAIRPPDRAPMMPPPRSGSGSKPRYLSTRSPIVSEVVSELARFSSRAQAVRRLDGMMSGVARSVSLPGSDDPGRPVVWISGFGVSVEQLREGFRGQYARLSVEALPGGFWTIRAEQLAVPLHLHPTRARKAEPHPNWGHPILRKAANNPRLPGRPGKRYPTLDAAMAELEQLKREYPDTSILNDGLLFIMVFDRTATPPIRRIRLEIRPTDDGRYTIFARPNQKPAAEGGA